MPRDLTVRVRADVGAYQKAMSAAASSTDQFAQSGLRLQKVGMRISGIGDTLTKRVTLPLVLAGAAAVKMASDFDKSFVQMQTLAGVSADEVDSLKESVLDLAGETGRAPQELAEALYFLQSSGLDSAQAMDALEVSAKASAVGLGDTATVADAVSSAMLAYAESGLSAAEATDVLIATARAGKAEPAELAEQMGRLLPIASELGIQFGDVGGAIAALSTKGNDAAMATTQLVNVMSKLLKPSQQAAKLLDEVGLSTDGIRQMISEKGLLGTLEELRARLGESGFIKYFEDVQAVQGALALLGGDLNKTKEIFAEVNDSVGATDNAFSKWAESMGAQNAQAFAKFQVALIQVGEVLAPIASDVLSFVGDIVAAFSDLPSGAQTAILAFLGVAAALGPLMSVGGRFITIYGTITRLLPQMAVPAGTLEGAFSGAAVGTSKFSAALNGLTKATFVVGALVALREVLMALEDDTRGIDVSGLENELLDLADTGKFAGENLKKVFSDLDLAADPQKIEAQADRLGKLDEALAQLAARDPASAAAAFREISRALQDQGASADQVEGFFKRYATAVAEADTASRTGAGGVDAAKGAMDDLGLATEEATSALQEYSDALKAMFDPLFAAVDATMSNADALRQAEAAEKAVAEAIRDHGAKSAEAYEAQLAFEEANRAVARSAIDEKAAIAGLADAVRSGDVSVDDAIATLRTLVQQGDVTQEAAAQMAHEFGATAKQADFLTDSLDNTTGSAQTLGQQRPQVKVSETGNRATQATLGRTREAANSIPPSRKVTVTASDRASGTIRLIQRQVNALTGKTITITTRLVQYAVPSYQTFGGGQAAGGPVSASKWYIVGEKGPEAFIPDQSGYIVPNHAMGSVGNWGGGGGGMGGYVDNRIINITTGADPQQVVAALRRAGDMGLPITIRGRSL